jgi:hypothetical protein
MSFRVIYHEPVCPDCGSSHITTQDVHTTDGLTEAAHICQDCGAAWPVACIAEHIEAQAPAPDHQARPHLVLRIDARPPDTGRAGRWYWCPRCDAYLTGTELASVATLHYTPGPDRAITEDDLIPEAARS